MYNEISTVMTDMCISTFTCQCVPVNVFENLNDKEIEILIS